MWTEVKEMSEKRTSPRILRKRKSSTGDGERESMLPNSIPLPTNDDCKPSVSDLSAQAVTTSALPYTKIDGRHVPILPKPPNPAEMETTSNNNNVYYTLHMATRGTGTQINQESRQFFPVVKKGRKSSTTLKMAQREEIVPPKEDVVDDIVPRKRGRPPKHPKIFPDFDAARRREGASLDRGQSFSKPPLIVLKNPSTITGIGAGGVGVVETRMLPKIAPRPPPMTTSETKIMIMNKQGSSTDLKKEPTTTQPTVTKKISIFTSSLLEDPARENTSEDPNNKSPVRSKSQNDIATANQSALLVGRTALQPSTGSTKSSMSVSGVREIAPKVAASSPPTAITSPRIIQVPISSASGVRGSPIIIIQQSATPSLSSNSKSPSISKTAIPRLLSVSSVRTIPSSPSGVQPETSASVSTTISPKIMTPQKPTAALGPQQKLILDADDGQESTNESAETSRWEAYGAYGPSSDNKDASKVGSRKSSRGRKSQIKKQTEATPIPLLIQPIQPRQTSNLTNILITTTTRPPTTSTDAGDKNNSLQCELCGEVSASEHDLNVHLDEIHLKPFECRFCDRKFPKAKNRNSHEGSSHADKLYLLDQGGSVKRKFICNYCKTEFDDPETKQAHARQHILKRLCRVCKKILTTFVSLPYMCEKCGQEFRSNETIQYRQHLEESSGECTGVFGECCYDRDERDAERLDPKKSTFTCMLESCKRGSKWQNLGAKPQESQQSLPSMKTIKQQQQQQLRHVPSQSIQIISSRPASTVITPQQPRQLPSSSSASMIKQTAEPQIPTSPVPENPGAAPKQRIEPSRKGGGGKLKPKLKCLECAPKLGAMAELAALKAQETGRPALVSCYACSKGVIGGASDRSSANINSSAAVTRTVIGPLDLLPPPPTTTTTKLLLNNDELEDHKISMNSRDTRLMGCSAAKEEDFKPCTACGEAFYTQVRLGIFPKKRRIGETSARKLVVHESFQGVFRQHFIKR